MGQVVDIMIKGRLCPCDETSMLTFWLIILSRMVSRGQTFGKPNVLSEYAAYKKYGLIYYPQFSNNKTLLV